MHTTFEWLQVGMSTNYVVHCGQVPQSCSYFQCSAEGVLPQLNPPNNRQLNNDNHNQNRQQDNRRQRQTQHRDLQQDRSRGVTGGREHGRQ